MLWTQNRDVQLTNIDVDAVSHLKVKMMEFDESTPVLSREELIERLGGVKETVQIISVYKAERRKRQNEVMECHSRLMNSCNLTCDVPYTQQGMDNQLTTLTYAIANRKGACMVERYMRDDAIKALQNIAPWARDLSSTRNLLRAYFRKNPRWNSSDHFLARYIFSENTDTIDLGELVSELISRG